MHKKVLVNNHGQSLIELILAIALASLFLSTFIFGILSIREAFDLSNKTGAAKILIQKEIESLRSIKESSWSSLALPGTYHTLQNGNIWQVATNTIESNGFTRGFTVENVCRISAGTLPVDCSTAGAKNDPSTKSITVSVSWDFFGSHTLSSTIYLSRYFNNSTWTQTTQADFNAGNSTNVVTTNNNGGEVQLAASGGGNWNSPQIIATRQLGSALANSVTVANNKAYLVTNSQTGADFFIFDVTDPTNPVANGSFDLGGSGFKLTVVGSFAYIATANTGRELTILNISNPASPTLAGFYNSPGTAVGRGVSLVGNTAVLTTDNNTSGTGYELYVLNITNPAAPSLIGGLNLAAATRDVLISGNFAYIASTSNSTELQVVNISNPATPSIAGSFNTSGNTDASSLFFNTNKIYLTTSRLEILNVTNPAAITQIGNYNSAGTPFGVFVSGNNAFLAHSQNSSQFKVVDITIPATPSLYGTADLAAQGNSVFVAGDFAFLATSNTTAQFQIIRGGSSGLYQSNGSFESQDFNAGGSVAFNRVNMTSIKPANTTIRLQVAVNNDNSTWNYLGPDGTAASYFDPDGAVDLGQTSGQYLKFKAFLTGNGSVTPILNDVTVNYSP